MLSNKPKKYIPMISKKKLSIRIKKNNNRKINQKIAKIHSRLMDPH